MRPRVLAFHWPITPLAPRASTIGVSINEVIDITVNLNKRRPASTLTGGRHLPLIGQWTQDADDIPFIVFHLFAYYFCCAFSLFFTSEKSQWEIYI